MFLVEKKWEEIKKKNPKYNSNSQHPGSNTVNFLVYSLNTFYILMYVYFYISYVNEISYCSVTSFIYYTRNISCQCIHFIAVFTSYRCTLIYLTRPLLGTFVVVSNFPAWNHSVIKFFLPPQFQRALTFY